MRHIFLRLGIAIGLLAGATSLAYASQNGGTVIITAKTQLKSTAVNGLIQANAKGPGTGGSIQIQINSNITLGTKPGEYTLSVNAGTTNGNAGQITVDPGQTGGTPNQVLFDVPTASAVHIVSATSSSTSGTGGIVVIKGVAVNLTTTQPINVNAAILVDGGSGLGSTAL